MPPSEQPAGRDEPAIRFERSLTDEADREQAERMPEVILHAGLINGDGLRCKTLAQAVRAEGADRHGQSGERGAKDEKSLCPTDHRRAGSQAR